MTFTISFTFNPFVLVGITFLASLAGAAGMVLGSFALAGLTARGYRIWALERGLAITEEIFTRQVVLAFVVTVFATAFAKSTTLWSTGIMAALGFAFIVYCSVWRR